MNRRFWLTRVGLLCALHATLPTMAATSWTPPNEMAGFSRIDSPQTKPSTWAYQHPGGAQATLTVDQAGAGRIPSDSSHPIAMQLRDYEIRKISQEILAAGAPPRRTANEMVRLKSPMGVVEAWFDAFLISAKEGDRHVLHWLWIQDQQFWRLRIDVRAQDKLSLDEAQTLARRVATERYPMGRP